MEATIDTPTVATTSTPETTASPAAPAIAPADPSSPTAAAPSSPPRPASFREALAQQESKPSTDVIAGEPPESAARVPPAIAPPVVDKKGPIPFEVHDTAIKNARETGRKDAEAQFDRDYGWAKAIPKESLQEMHRIATKLSTDPVGFYHELGGQLQRHPVHASALRSEAGRALSGHANGEPPPDVQLVNEQGQVTGMTYSAEAQAKRDGWLRAQWRDDLQREIGPWKQQEEQRQREALQASITKENEARADAVMADLAEILEYDQKAPEKTLALFQEVDALMAQGVSAHTAALQVRKARVLPQQQQSATAQAAQTFRQKAAAQTADGRSASATPPKRPQTRQELAALLRAGESGG